MLISFLIVKIFLAFKCELSSAHALETADSSRLYQMIYENKVMSDKKIDRLEEKIDAGLDELRSELETYKEGKSQKLKRSFMYVKFFDFISKIKRKKLRSNHFVKTKPKLLIKCTTNVYALKCL